MKFCYGIGFSFPKQIQNADTSYGLVLDFRIVLEGDKSSLISMFFRDDFHALVLGPQQK